MKAPYMCYLAAGQEQRGRTDKCMAGGGRGGPQGARSAAVKPRFRYYLLSWNDDSTAYILWYYTSTDPIGYLISKP